MGWLWNIHLLFVGKLYNIFSFPFLPFRYSFLIPSKQYPLPFHLDLSSMPFSTNSIMYNPLYNNSII